MMLSKYLYKIAIKILQDSVVTQTVFGMLTVHLFVANFLQYIMCQKL